MTTVTLHRVLAVVGKWTLHLSYFDAAQEKALEDEPSVVNVYDANDVLIDRNQEWNTLALGSDYKFKGTYVCAYEV